VLIKDFVHFPGINVVSAGNDDVLLPVDDEQVPLFVQVADIPRREPPVPDDLGRCLGIVVIFLRNLGSLEQDFSGLAQFQVLCPRIEIDDAAVRLRQRLNVASAEVSESPYSSTIAEPVSASHWWIVSSATGAAPEKQPLMKFIFVEVNFGWFRSPTNIVGTPPNRVGLKRRVNSQMTSGVGRGTRILVHPLRMALFIMSV
jgi:hypothetical protein